MFKALQYPITVAEMTLFRKQALSIMTEGEVAELIGHLAFTPTEGDIMQGTGGIRKLRWALEGRGKQGGARIIYFFYDLNMPLYLLAAYPKSKKIDLTDAEKNGMRQFVKGLVRTQYGEKLHKGESK